MGMDSENDLSVLILSDTTIEPIRNYIKDCDSAINVEIGLYDQVVPTLLSKDLSRYTLIVIFTQLAKVSSEFSKAIYYENFDYNKIQSEVSEFANIIKSSADRSNSIMIFNWTLPWWSYTNRVTGWVDKFGINKITSEANLTLANTLADKRNIYIIDQAELLLSANTPIFDPKLWAMGKINYSGYIFELLAAQIVGLIWAVTGKTKKMIILDLDNTLWGGILGEIGWENLKLGGTDPIGESFSIFQKQLKSLFNRGVLLAIVSKNDEQAALEAIEKHPEMILKKDNFVAWRINWQDKATNIKDIINEVNIGMNSVVFIDDSPHERDWVRNVLPEVFVPDWPDDPVMYPYAFKKLWYCFEKIQITEEDRSRTDMIKSEKLRKDTLNLTKSKEDWIRSLELKVSIEPLSSYNLARAVQLINRTNQFNLKTRRFTDEEYRRWTENANRSVYVISADDKFGSYGIIGVISFEKKDEVLNIVDFLISCRALGRGIENIIIEFAKKQAKNQDVSKLTAELVPTAKNRPIQEFLETTADERNENVFTFELNEDKSKYPDYIEVTEPCSI